MTLTSAAPATRPGRRTPAVVSPMVGRAPLRPRHDPLSAVLLTLSLTLLAATSAAQPLVREATQNAAVTRVLAGVPEGATAGQAPVVRVTSGEAPGPGSRVSRVLGEVPGLGAPSVFGISFGAEVEGRGSGWQSVVVGPGGTQEARLVAVDDPAAVLVPTTADEGPEDGVWIADETALATGLAAGDPATVSITSNDGTTAVTLPVAGVYRSVENPRTPVDRPGSTFWADRVGLLPRSPDPTRTRPPSIVTTVDTLTTISPATTDTPPLDDTVLWSVEAPLAPSTPLLQDLRATADAVGGMRADLPPIPDVDGPIGRYEVASGIPALRDDAEAIAAAAVDRSRAAAWGGLTLGAAAVVACALLSEARRRRERELAAGLGLHPVRVGWIAAVETMIPAVLGVVLGVAGAWALVSVVAGPGGRLPAEALRPATLTAVVAVAAGIVVLAAAATAATWRAAQWRTDRGRTRTRTVPWRTVVLVAAAATLAGVVSRPGTAGLDLAAPVLVAAGTGVLSSAALVAAARAMIRGTADGHSTTRLSRGQAVRTLAVRRVRAGGSVRDVVIVLLSAGLGLAGFLVVADRGVADAVDAKASVLTGAAVTVRLPFGEEIALDPAAEPFPGIQDKDFFDEAGFLTSRVLPPARDLRVPPGETVVWSERVRLDGNDPILPMIVLDTDTAEDAIDWGPPGGPLDDTGRAALASLRTASLATRDEPVGSRPFPVVLAGDPRGYSVGRTIRIRTTSREMFADVVGVVPAFPGQGTAPTMVIADTDTFLTMLQFEDPRYAVAEGQSVPGARGLPATYWSSRDVRPVVTTLAAAGLPAETVTTLEAQKTRPAFVAVTLVRDYQLALAALIVVAAALALALQADKDASGARSATAVLRRTPLGRGGVVRSLVYSQVVVVAAGVVGAAGGLLVLLPVLADLADPDRGLLPALTVDTGAVLAGLLVVTVTSVVVALIAAVTVVARLRPGREDEVLRDDVV